MDTSQLIGQTKLTYNKKILERLINKPNSKLTVNDLSTVNRNKFVGISNEAISEFFDCLDMGMSINKSCDFAGIPKNFIKQIKQFAVINPNLEPYNTLAKKIKYHIAKFEKDRLRVMVDSDDWKAHSDLLKMRRSEDYSYKTKVDINVQLVNEIKEALETGIIDENFIQDKYPELSSELGINKLIEKSVEPENYIIE